MSQLDDHDEKVMSEVKENALQSWQKIEKLLAGKEVVVFLDYDGTISPIVSEPERAFMRPGMKGVLQLVASSFVTAIVTGRSREKVYDFVQLDDVFYAGSHGFEIQGPVATPVNCKVADDIRPTLERCQTELHGRLRHIPGYDIEDNKYSISVHYRNVPAEYVEEVHKVVASYVENRPEVVVKHGKKVLELKPKVDWNKGSAVLWILEALGLDKRDDVMPLYLGDDVTDEDAFRALKNRKVEKKVPTADDMKEMAAPLTAARVTPAAIDAAGDVIADDRGGREAVTINSNNNSSNGDNGSYGNYDIDNMTNNHTVNSSNDFDSSYHREGWDRGRGLGIIVNPYDPERAMLGTHAHFSLKDPEEVQIFLETLVQKASMINKRGKMGRGDRDTDGAVNGFNRLMPLTNTTISITNATNDASSGDGTVAIEKVQKEKENDAAVSNEGAV